jgi:hypothetical protein
MPTRRCTPDLEWLANITNEKMRKRAHQSDVAGFILFTGLQEFASLRTVALSPRALEARELSKAAFPS